MIVLSITKTGDIYIMNKKLSARKKNKDCGRHLTARNKTGEGIGSARCTWTRLMRKSYIHMLVKHMSLIRYDVNSFYFILYQYYVKKSICTHPLLSMGTYARIQLSKGRNLVFCK
ncbi:hypothetical protein ABFX02_08G078500 [Erythranthe guttata]